MRPTSGSLLPVSSVADDDPTFGALDTALENTVAPDRGPELPAFNQRN
jgi:hypothetical protein